MLCIGAVSLCILETPLCVCLVTASFTPPAEGQESFPDLVHHYFIVKWVYEVQFPVLILDRLEDAHRVSTANPHQRFDHV